MLAVSSEGEVSGVEVASLIDGDLVASRGGKNRQHLVGVGQKVRDRRWSWPRQYFPVHLQWESWFLGLYSIRPISLVDAEIEFHGFAVDRPLGPCSWGASGTSVFLIGWFLS